MKLSPNDRHSHLEPARAAKDFANNVRRFSLVHEPDHFSEMLAVRLDGFHIGFNG